MKRNIIAVWLFVAFCVLAVSCRNADSPKSNADDGFAGFYDLHMVYDSISADDGTWFSEKEYEELLGKSNPPLDGHLTIEKASDGKYVVTATVISNKTGEEKTFFKTNAVMNNDVLVFEKCKSDYYYDTMGEYIRFTFKDFACNMSVITFKSIYTINLGYDYSYLTSYTCTKRN